MQIKHLTMEHIRGFEHVTIAFEPGMNLLVGENGAGKSTVLDVLRKLLTEVLPTFTAYSGDVEHFHADDLMVGKDWLSAELEFNVGDLPLVYEIQEWCANGQCDRRELRCMGTSDRASVKDDLRALKTEDAQPLAIYFSPYRSLLESRQNSVGSTDLDGQATAFADALACERGLRLHEFARWWVTQEKLASESSFIKKRLDVLKDAITAFLDTGDNPSVLCVPDDATVLLKKEGIVLHARQHSDGERGVLALMLDLTRRLSQANPSLPDPLRAGKAVVLIDELDLQLHPRWQRTIAEKLTQMFPACQFIATSHSPQIIGELPPEHIILLEKGKAPYRPNQSFGMDSNWVLQFLMDTGARNRSVYQKLDQIGDLIEDEEYPQARIEIDRLREEIGEFVDLVRLQARLDRLKILGV